MFIRINQALEASRVKREEGEKGFTLIELLVVVLIIGVLAAIAIPIFLGQQATARDNAVKAQITQAKTALVAALVDPDATFPAAGALGAGTIPGFTASEDITVNLQRVSATDPEEGFCLSGNYSGETASFAIDDKGAADRGVCTAGVAVFSDEATVPGGGEAAAD